MAATDRRLALKLHPDKCTAANADEAFKRALTGPCQHSLSAALCALACRTLRTELEDCAAAVVSKAFSCLSDGDKRAAYDRCARRAVYSGLCLAFSSHEQGFGPQAWAPLVPLWLHSWDRCMACKLWDS